MILIRRFMTDQGIDTGRKALKFHGFLMLFEA